MEGAIHVRNRPQWSQWVLFIPAALLLIIINIAPSVDALLSSFNIVSDYGYSQKTVQVGWENYRILFNDRAILYSLNITALWATLNTLLTGAVSLLLAHAMLKQKRKKRRSIIYPLLMIPLGIPLYIAAPLWRAFMHGEAGVSWFSALTGISMNLITDPLAAFSAVLITSVWLNVPMTTFVVFSQLNHVDKDLLDAAQIDTKYDFEIMHYIAFPIIRTSIITMIALNFVKAFKEFTLIHLMTNGGVPLVEGITERFIVGSTTTLGVFMYSLFGDGQYGITAAFSVFMTSVVAIVLYFWYCSTVPKSKRRLFNYVLIMTILLGIELLFDTLILKENVSIPRLLIFIVLCLSFTYRGLFLYALFSLLFYRVLDIIFHGFLVGFSPLIPATLFILFSLSKNSSTNTSVAHLQTNRGKIMQISISPILRILFEFLYRAGMYIVVIVTGMATVAIVYLLVRLSVSNLNACFFPSLWPTHFSLEAFTALFFKEGILRYFYNTAVLAIGSAVIIPIVVIPAAWFLSNVKKHHANKIVSSVHTLGTLGGMHSLVPLFSIFLALGLLNTYTGLILVYVVHALPFSLVNIKNFFEGLGRELREPARIEGTTTLQYIQLILIPLSLPIIKTSMLVAFLGAWNGFNAPLLLLSEEHMYPVSLKLYTYVGSIASGNPQWNLFAAASLVNLVFIALVGGRKLSKDPT